MQIEALQIYCDVIRYRSFSQAAEENNVTQSTVSQAVQRLEEHLGAKLIDRSFRPWRVTPEGKKCHDRCREILEIYYGMEHDIGGAKEERPSEVRVSAIYSVGFTYLGSVTSRFEKEYPNEKLVIDYDRPDKVCKKVVDAEVDVGLLSFPSRRDLQTQPWLEEEMVVVCTPGNRIASGPEVSVGNLAGLSFVSFDRDLNISKKISQFLRQHGVRARVALRFDNIEAIKRAVEGSSYVAILPRPSVRREVEARTLVALSFSDASFTRSLGIIHRKCNEISPAMQHFLELLADVSG